MLQPPKAQVRKPGIIPISLDVARSKSSKENFSGGSALCCRSTSYFDVK